MLLPEDVRELKTTFFGTVLPSMMHLSAASYVTHICHLNSFRLSPTDQARWILDSISVFTRNAAMAGIVLVFVMQCYDLMIAIMSCRNQRLKFQVIIAAFNFFFLPVLFRIIIEIFDLKVPYDY